MSKSMVLKPKMSEKSYSMSEAGVYVFNVPLTTNKVEIARAVEAQFDVSVVNVKVLIQKGKTARSIRIGARTRSNVSGQRSDTKKAYVTLKKGDSIPVFAALDEQAEKDEKRAELIAKASEKAEKKEAKKTESKPKRSILKRSQGDK